MKLCTFERAGCRRLGVLVDDGRDGRVVDAHLATVTSLAGHLTPKRSREIATALVPPTLMGLLLNGRHGFNALADGLARLGPSVAHDPELSFALADVELVPVHPADATAAPGAGWQTIPFGDDGVDGVGDESFEVRVLHSDGRDADDDCFGIIGTGGDVVLVSVGSSAVLQTLDEPIGDEVRQAVGEAAAEVARSRPLHVGDVVRTGAAPRPEPLVIDLTVELLEALLTQKL